MNYRREPFSNTSPDGTFTPQATAYAGRQREKGGSPAALSQIAYWAIRYRENSWVCGFRWSRWISPRWSSSLSLLFEILNTLRPSVMLLS